jgi:hypothetical protein
MRAFRIGIAAASVALLTASAVIVPASGEDPAPSTPARVDGGVLAIETGTTDRVYLDADKDGIAESTQALSGRKDCLVATDETLLKIDGLPPRSDATDTASFIGDALGVAEKKSGTSCGTVDATGEKLVLTLNQVGLKGQIGDRLAASAYLDVELKQDAKIFATASTAGATQTSTFELRSGSTIDPNVPTGAVVGGAVVFNCTARADSGPDSTTGDNCRWPISSPSWLPGGDDEQDFDTLVLEARNGSFSLDGGADGLVPPAPPSDFPQRASFFELVTVADGELICGDETRTVAGSGDAPEITVRRLENSDLDGDGAPDEECVLIPYTLTNGGSFAQFLKPLDTQSSAQFVATIDWNVAASEPLPLPVTEVDFEAGEGPVAIGWCPDPKYTDGEFVGITDPAAVPDLSAALSGKQFACLGTQTAKVLDGDLDYVVNTEEIYVLGDIRFQR